MDVLLRGGRVIDTSQGGEAQAFDAQADVLIVDGRIADIGRGLAAPSGARVVDVGGALVCAGLFRPRLDEGTGKN